MQTLRYLIQKEFIQIFRNKALLPMMTLLPIIQLIVLSNAASNDVKDVRLVMVDNDQSEISRSLTRKISANDRFTLVEVSFSHDAAFELMQRNKVDIILEVPSNFEREYYRGETPKVQMLVNAINGQQATVGSGYLNNIIASLSAEIQRDESLVMSTSTPRATALVEVSSNNWYNPELKYPHFMAPGILAELAALLTIVLSAMNVVREREIGTIEQINVTPIKKWEFILGKLVPFLCIGLILVTVGLVASKLIFDIPIRGSLLLVFGYAIINLICVLGLGLLISNFADTQQQAIFVAFFFVLIFILMCGLFTPIESMPKWAQYATIPNPLAHFISVTRKVLLKGSGFWDIRWEFIYTIILAILFNVAAVWSYKKQQ
ncbi:ABC transporter permease [Ulvibacterium marinum]|uniref:ABC transporter permease n=1 Tax=Ulvibacterium marinum TaxID=2419782 RepID=A0A3B0BZP7_9FLAO|nr:ABC transporter permease [Ulvibacterium marinum]RKN76746.1 ABC transporter permease [Ulvibacterium marinum]